MKWCFLPLLLFLLWLPFSAMIDMKVAASFYGVDGFLKTFPNPLLAALAAYGNFLGPLLTIASAALWLFTFYRPSWHAMRKGTLLVMLVSILSICIVNLVFKEIYGRPRPRQVIEFGGAERFRPIYAPLWRVPNDTYKSFPSGHVSMGMLFITLGLVGWKERCYTIACFGFLLGIPLSIALGYVRMTQGAHFLSDVLASAVLVWTLSIVLIMLFYPTTTPKETQRRRIEKRTH